MIESSSGRTPEKVPRWDLTGTEGCGGVIRHQRIYNFWLSHALILSVFGCLMGFIIHFYIIFGTNLQTQGPVQIVVFLPISVFRRKGISNGIQTEWNLRESYFWNKRDPGDLEWTSRKKRGGHEAGRRAPTLVGPSQLHRPTSFAYIYSYTLKPSGRATKHLFHHRNLLYPWDPILGPFSALRRRGNRSRRASTSTP